MHQSTEATGNVSLLDHFDKIMPAKKTHEVAFKHIIVFIFTSWLAWTPYVMIIINIMFKIIITIVARKKKKIIIIIITIIIIIVIESSYSLILLMYLFPHGLVNDIIIILITRWLECTHLWKKVRGQLDVLQWSTWEVARGICHR